MLCNVLSSLLLRLVKDHLSGDEHDSPTENLTERPKTNALDQPPQLLCDLLVRMHPLKVLSVQDPASIANGQN